MIDIGIIGCGKIADQHMSVIEKLQECKVVAVCDVNEYMARQLADRFDIRNHFSNVKKLLEIKGLDVVHITTPPQSHFDLAMQCLQAGVNVYVEKPFTTNSREAEKLIDLANARGLRLTVGHNALFTDAANQMRALIRKGFLGGKPVHIESIYCYNLKDQRYAKALLGDKSHWVRDLPGKLLHNIISHGISKIVEFLPGNIPTVKVHAFTSNLLKSISEIDIIDELRVIICNDENVTAYFTFSSQMRPALHQFRLYGPDNSLIVDDDNQTLITLENKKYKSYLNYFFPPLIYGKKYLMNSCRNIKKFISKDLYADSGMRFLIQSFYDSIRDNSPVPIPYEDILATSRIMDSIFRQITSCEVSKSERDAQMCYN